jgi:hypothetical protein
MQYTALTGSGSRQNLQVFIRSYPKTSFHEKAVKSFRRFIFVEFTFCSLQHGIVLPFGLGGAGPCFDPFNAANGERCYLDFEVSGRAPGDTIAIVPNRRPVAVPKSFSECLRG